MRMVDMTGDTTFEYDKHLSYLTKKTLLIFHHPEQVIDNNELISKEW